MKHDSDGLLGRVASRLKVCSGLYSLAPATHKIRVWQLPVTPLPLSEIHPSQVARLTNIADPATMTARVTANRKHTPHARYASIHRRQFPARSAAM
jgi:hypothetical protein